MSLGIVMLAHEALHRAAQVARHWAKAGCPVVIHVDKSVSIAAFSAFERGLADMPNIRFSPRHAGEWGKWSLVQASQSGAEMLLAEFPDVQHVYLVSGLCLPLRPVDELRAYLARYPDTDFIESVTSQDASWAVGGLDHERFLLRFPFSWRRQRRLFDGYVRLQRRIRFKRRIPPGIEPHLGAQWWCLTRKTLAAILQDPRRAEFDRYFARVWIPDECYYQTLARRHARRIESRSLTLTRFDAQGKPHVFYDDHLDLLRQSHCFVARKIWPGADRLYSAFSGSDSGARSDAAPNPAPVERHFAKTRARRTEGRAGLHMHSRAPATYLHNTKSAAPYTMLAGFDQVIHGFAPWLAGAVDAQVHGHLFAPERAEFAGGETIAPGAQSDHAALRDYNPTAFLTNLLWNGRPRHQCFQFGPRDTQDIAWFTATDPNAQIFVVTGAWAVALFQSGAEIASIRAKAARLQQVENAWLGVLRSPHTRARLRICTLAEFVANPAPQLHALVDAIGRKPAQMPLPGLVDLAGFDVFLHRLRNAGMVPTLVGDFDPADDAPAAMAAPRPRLIGP